MLLEVNNLSLSYGTHQVLGGVSFTADSGEVVGILGANGAGKTTLLRVVNGILKPDSGQVLFEGHPLAQRDLSQIGYLPEERGLYRHMRAGEQVIYLARLKGLSRGDAEANAGQWFAHLKVSDWFERPVSRLSKGMQQKVQFIATVIHHPRLLILDEPFSGFDRDNAAMLHDEILRLSASGTAILLSTHNLDAVSDLCTKTVEL